MAEREEMLAAYKEGVPLAEAADRCAPEPIRREYHAAQEQDKARGEARVRALALQLRSSSLPEMTRAGLAEANGIDLHKLETDPTYMRVLPGDDRLLSTQMKHPTEYEPAMRNSLLDSIRDGQHAAIGYEERQRSDRRLVRIPADSLQTFTAIDLFSAEVTVDGLKLVAVRLVAPGSLPGERDAGNALGASLKKDQIEIAFKAGVDSKEIKPGDLKKQVVGVVQKHLRATATPKTIWKYARPLHRALTELAKDGKG